MSDPATFSFSLTACRAVWAASLTNGLDFKLLEGDYISQGITRVAPFYIRIVPTKLFPQAQTGKAGSISP